MKRKKIRGTRTCGGGAHKKRRGKGSKGGKGNAGAYEHHFVRSLKKGIKKGARGRGFHSILSHTPITINVGELDEILEELIAKGEAEERDDIVYVDVRNMGIEKILGRGRVTKKLNVSVEEISGNAKEKIERAGGFVSVSQK